MQSTESTTSSVMGSVTRKGLPTTASRSSTVSPGEAIRILRTWASKAMVEGNPPIRKGAGVRPFSQRPLAQACLCLLYTSDAADEEDSVDLGGRRIIKKK